MEQEISSIISQDEKFFFNGINDYNEYSIEELQNLISDNSGYIRCRSLIKLAYRGFSEIVLQELKIKN